MAHPRPVISPVIIPNMIQVGVWYSDTQGLEGRGQEVLPNIITLFYKVKNDDIIQGQFFLIFHFTQKVAF